MAAPWFETADTFDLLESPIFQNHHIQNPTADVELCPSTSAADNSTPVVRSPPKNLDGNPPTQLRRSSHVIKKLDKLNL